MVWARQGPFSQDTASRRLLSSWLDTRRVSAATTRCGGRNLWLLRTYRNLSNLQSGPCLPAEPSTHTGCMLLTQTVRARQARPHPSSGPHRPSRPFPAKAATHIQRACTASPHQRSCWVDHCHGQRFRTEAAGHASHAPANQHSAHTGCAETKPTPPCAVLQQSSTIIPCIVPARLAAHDATVAEPACLELSQALSLHSHRNAPDVTRATCIHSNKQYGLSGVCLATHCARRSTQNHSGPTCTQQGSPTQACSLQHSTTTATLRDQNMVGLRALSDAAATHDRGLTPQATADAARQKLAPTREIGGWAKPGTKTTCTHSPTP